jgi:class 3 adenylate cyclase
MDAPTTETLLQNAWGVLVSQLGEKQAAHFFERYVINGPQVLRSLQRANEIVVGNGNSPPMPDKRPHVTQAASSMQKAPDGPVKAPDSPVKPPHDLHDALGPPSAVIGRGEHRVGGSAHPTTQVDIARHLKLLDRKWLVTGYILRLSVPGHPTRRVPLNYRTIEIGNQGEKYDIELPSAHGGGSGTVVPEANHVHLQLRYDDSSFVLDPLDTQGLRVNGKPVSGMVALQDGDSIAAGPATLRIFRLLEPPAELTVVSGHGAGERYVIDTSEVRMGRFGKRDNDITLHDPTVSREHAIIRFRDGKFWLVPETTSSPTVVNGEPVEGQRHLIDNDQVLLGEQTLLFRLRGQMAKPKTLQQRTATVLFSDLKGWTPLAESMPLQDLINQMDEYFKEMGEIITTLGGTLMTYQGDAIMAVFGAPSSHKDDPWRACASALRMQNRLQHLNKRWEEERRAPLACGIGIHTGIVMVGELGHSSRLEYSVMGDTTNLAARLEQMTRDHDATIILSEATYKECSDTIQVEELGEVTVKGRSVPTRIYGLLALKEGG